MTEFTVRWAIDLDAPTPEAAARLALEILRDTDPASLGLLFNVTEFTDDVDVTEHLVDLSPGIR